MVVEMFNFWYFFWIFVQVGAIVGLYFTLRKAKPFTQDAVLFSLLLLGLIFHFLKMYIAPYGKMVDGEWVITNLGFRESWFVNICGANIALFPFFFLSKNKFAKDYMFYLGIISGFIVLFYPQEPIAKGDAATQMAEFWDVLRFYYHHWMILAVPILLVLLKKYKPSYKRVWTAPVGLLIVMLFIVLNRVFQSELGFIPMRNDNIIPNYNASFIFGPLNSDGSMDSLGKVFDIFCPKWFKTLPVSCEGYGYAVGETKYWPWFWMIFPVFILVTPIAFGISMIFDHKNFGKDITLAIKHIKEGGLKDDFKKLKENIISKVTAPNTDFAPKVEVTNECREPECVNNAK